jgi:hypothetical protein
VSSQLLLVTIVRCEGCGKQTLLYPSERAILDENPRLSITCEECVAAFRRDPRHFLRKRLSAASNGVPHA